MERSALKRQLRGLACYSFARTHLPRCDQRATETRRLPLAVRPCSRCFPERPTCTRTRQAYGGETAGGLHALAVGESPRRHSREEAREKYENEVESWRAFSPSPRRVSP